MSAYHLSVLVIAVYGLPVCIMIGVAMILEHQDRQR